VDAAGARAKALGVKRVMPLNVGGAFHTPLMQAAADAFARDLASAPFSPTATPVMSNVDAKPYTDPEGWPSRLTDQLVRPVRWSATIPGLVAVGADTLLEVGPGTTLTSMAKRAHPDLILRNFATPADLPLELAHA
jgi:[acyl-carrier-protein] S-malonyltransferase